MSTENFKEAKAVADPLPLTGAIEDSRLQKETAQVCLEKLKAQALAIVKKLDGTVPYGSEESNLLHTILGNVTRTVVALECLIAQGDQDALDAHENEQMILAAQEISRQVGQHF